MIFVFGVLLLALIGGMVKYIDDAFDEQNSHKGFICHASFLVGVCSLVAIVYLSAAAVFLFSVSVGCFFSRKLDNLPFKMLASLITTAVLALWIIGGLVYPIWVVCALTGLAFLDEKANNAGEDCTALRSIWRSILLHKPLLPMFGVFFGIVHGDWSFLILILAFDSAYFITRLAISSFPSFCAKNFEELVPRAWNIRAFMVRKERTK